MAFAAAGLAVIAHGGGVRVFRYTTEDTAATVDTADYFLTAIAQFNIGDLIYRITTTAGALTTAGFHVVKDKSATAIDVTDVLALTVTDTD